jgi:hypothetical protein
MRIWDKYAGGTLEDAAVRLQGCQSVLIKIVPGRMFAVAGV